MKLKGEFVSGSIADGRISDTWLDKKLRLFWYKSLNPISTGCIVGTTVRGLKRRAKQLGMSKVFVLTKDSKSEQVVQL